jgi:hypothetical protein
MSSLIACKKKNSADGDMLDEPSKSSISGPQASLAAPPPTSSGNWKITCNPSESPQDLRTYQITLSGAISETDENQPVKISISRTSTDKSSTANASAKQIAVDETGRGAVDPKGNLFLGFSGGALTGQFQALSKKYDGLLTLVNDQDTAGLGVQCDAVLLPPSP